MKKTVLLAFLVVIQLHLLAQNTTVYLIPVLHGLHKTNRQYNYDSVKAMVSRIQPQVIAVEMRSEDMAADSVYLKNNYPYEMWMMRYWFSNVSFQGFDWLGEELEGKPIPNRYWQDVSKIKYLQRRLEVDTEFTARLKNCRLYEEERMKFLQNGSLKDLLKSNDAILVKAYYDCLNGQLQGSDYEALTQFYDKRNVQMQKRLTEIVMANPGKKIVVLAGDDHYPYLLEHLRKLKVTIRQPV